MNCEYSELTTDFLAIGLLLAAVLFAWLMHAVKRRLREAHSSVWDELDSTALPLNTRLANSARLFLFILLGRYTYLHDNRLNRAATGTRLLLLIFLIGGVLTRYCW